MEKSEKECLCCGECYFSEMMKEYIEEHGMCLWCDEETDEDEGYF